MLAVLRREMSNYFTSPIGYIFLAVFYFFSGMFFCGGYPERSIKIFTLMTEVKLWESESLQQKIWKKISK